MCRPFIVASFVDKQNRFNPTMRFRPLLTLQLYTFVHWWIRANRYQPLSTIFSFTIQLSRTEFELNLIARETLLRFKVPFHSVFTSFCNQLFRTTIRTLLFQIFSNTTKLNLNLNVGASSKNSIRWPANRSFISQRSIGQQLLRIQNASLESWLRLVEIHTNELKIDVEPWQWEWPGIERV